MRQIWGGGAGEKKRLQYFEFGLQYLVQPLGVNPTYSTFKLHMFDNSPVLTTCPYSVIVIAPPAANRKWHVLCSNELLLEI